MSLSLVSHKSISTSSSGSPASMASVSAFILADSRCIVSIAMRSTSWSPQRSEQNHFPWEKTPSDFWKRRRHFCCSGPLT